MADQESQNKTTYLLGAGASAAAVPIVSDMYQGLDMIYRFISEDNYKLSESESFPDLNIKGFSTTKEQLRQELLTDLNWLIEQENEHHSFDTFAKKLVVRGRIEELNRLKLALSIFFVIIQAYRKCDRRYDTFFANILGQYYDHLPNNINILSWNYDFQLELGYSEYSGQSNLDLAQSMLRIELKHIDTGLHLNEFGVYKLNGSSIMQQHNFHKFFFLNENNKFGQAEFEKVVRNYAALKYIDNVYSNISFAWEDYKEITKNYIVSAKKSVSNTTDLVIIGYSFPLFNRAVDRELIQGMGNLNRVYIQDPEPEEKIQLFLSMRNDFDIKNIFTVRNTKQFYIPDNI